MIQVREQYGNIYVRILDTMDTFDYTLEKIRSIPQRVYKQDTGEWMFPQEEIETLLKEFNNQIVWVQPLREIVKGLPVKKEYVKKHLSWEEDHDFKDWKIQPYGYQRVSAHFLASRGQAATLDGVGLGKTPSVLAASQILFNQGKAKQALIVTLSALKGQWAKEVDKFMGERAYHASGTKTQRMKAIEEYRKDKSSRFLVINYEMLRDDKYVKLLKEIGFDIIALDEAQKIKTGVTDKMLGMKPSQNALGAYKMKDIPYRFIATATPVQSKAEEIWSLYYFLNENVLGTWEEFRERYCKYHPRFGINGYQNEGELYYRISPHFIRRTKEMPEIQQQLPKVKHDHIFLETTDAQRKLEANIFNKIEEVKDQSRSINPNGQVINGEFLNAEAVKEYYDGMVQGYMQFLLAASDSPELLSMSDSKMASSVLEECNVKGNDLKRSPKTDHLLEFLSQLNNDEPNAKIVIFSRFERMVRLLHSKIPGSVMYSGELSEREKNFSVNQFIENPNCKVFIGTDAASTGLNLQVASYLLHFDMPWNATDITQRNGRIDRTGNPNPNITIMYYVMSDSYEEQLVELLNKKAELATNIIDGGVSMSRSQDFSRLALERVIKRKTIKA